MTKYFFIVKNEDANSRLDKFLCSQLKNISRSHVQKLIENNDVTVNEKCEVKKYKLIEGDKIIVNIPESKPLEVNPENIPLDIIYEDKDIIVVNKPKNMVVHPAPGNYQGTLVNALLNHCKDSLSGINGVMRPGIVHRIDKDTTGLLVVAKNDKSHNMLAAQIKNHSFTREYEAIVNGSLSLASGTVKTLIGRHKTDRKKMSVLNTGGKTAITHYEVIQNYEKYSHIRLKLETGRTHQIRVHMAYLGHPVLGDEVYGKGRKNEFLFLKGQCLHAKCLGFVHPTSHKYVCFTSSLPPYFEKILEILNQQNYTSEE